LRYEVLGPVSIIRNQTRFFISARKIETLLAVLLVRANQVLSINQLMTEIWEGVPPRRANAGLHVYVSQLRKLLHEPEQAASPVITQPPGYLLHVEPGQLDLHVFEAAVSRGRALLEKLRYGEASELFEHALGLWRGPVFEEYSCGPILRGFNTWLTETRLECVEMLIEAQLALGRHRQLVGRLYSLVAEFPLREAFRRQLMLALYRTKRPVDALKVYETTRLMLREDLGLEPSLTLRELQLAILRGDVCLDWRWRVA
jgi:DNA-binding SARP family transcriptional activator